MNNKINGYGFICPDQLRERGSKLSYCAISPFVPSSVVLRRHGRSITGSMSSILRPGRRCFNSSLIPRISKAEFRPWLTRDACKSPLECWEGSSKKVLLVGVSVSKKILDKSFCILLTLTTNAVVRQLAMFSFIVAYFLSVFFLKAEGNSKVRIIRVRRRKRNNQKEERQQSSLTQGCPQVLWHSWKSWRGVINIITKRFSQKGQIFLTG